MIDIKKSDALMAELLKAQPPRVSIFIPTHRAFPDNKQDPINYKNKLQEVETLLDAKYPRREWQDTFTALQGLLDDDDFWNHTTEGLAVLAGGGRVATFMLDAPVGPLHYVGKHYHLPPIYPMLQSIGQAYLTDISRDRFSIFQVSREGLEQVELPEVKASFPELFDDFDANSNLNVGSYSGIAGTHHGHRARAEEVAKDREKYFRYLDGAFTKLHRDTGLPMILVGTESNVNEYQQLAKGNFYLDPIKKPMDSIDPRDLYVKARDILRPYLEKELDALRTRINNKRKENKILLDLGEIRTAAQEGRVELLILPDRPRESESKALDKAAEQVLMNGGTLYSLDWDALALLGGFVAVLRY